MKILIIDDDEITRYVLRRYLEGTELTLLEARDSAEGIALARQEKPDLVLLDYLLGGERSYPVLEALSDLRVVIHTAKDLDDDERHRLLRHARAILPKQSSSRETTLAQLREAIALTSS